MNMKKNPHNVVTMGQSAINAAATYTFGYGNIHRKLARERAQREGRLDVTAEDLAATASAACQMFMAELQQREAKTHEAKAA